jgi:hypothetical protein
MDPRSAAGVRFARSDAYPEYMQIKGPGSTERKRLARLSWSAKEVELKSTRSKSYAQALTEEDKEEGEFMTPDVVWKQEGGTPGAWIRTCNYCKAANSMGGDWTRINPLTKGNGESGFEVFYIKTKRSTLFSRKWAEHREATVEDTEVDAPAADAVQANAVLSPEAIVRPKAQAKAKAIVAEKAGTPRKQGVAADAESSDAKRTRLAKQSLDEAMANATKTVVAYQKVCSKVVTILQAVDNCTEWEWAANAPQLSNMKRAKADLDDAAKPFNTEMIYDIKKLRQKFAAEPERFVTKLKNMNLALDPKVMALEHIVGKIQNMHAMSIAA